MKASYAWIKQYLSGYAGTPEDMQRELTFSGTEVEEVVPGGPDHVLDLGVTSNRVDCLGHLGLAREVAAVSGAELAPPSCEAVAKGGPTADRTRVDVEDPGRCPRYVALVIEGVSIAPSPDWLRERLETLGQPAVNNVVDATNFVMLELNQSLHAFDLARLEEQRIVVRRAREGEVLRAINDKQYPLVPEDLVIADAVNPVALAGVMGGRDSEVSEQTRDLLLESAWFEPVGVRRTSRRHRLGTDSSYRFERGIDRAGVLDAARRAAALILEVAGGTLRTDPIDVGGPGEAPAAVDLRLQRIERICGIPVAGDEVARILRSLECDVEEGKSGTLRVTPPSFRADLTREIDLVEEVIRIHGFEHLPDHTGITVRVARETPERTFREDVRDHMAGLGLMEILTPNFVKDGLPGEVAFLAEGAGLAALAPVRKGEGALRRSFLPTMLEVRKRNHDVGNDDLSFFEIANLHFDAGDESVPEHVPALGWLLDGDLRDARGVAEALGRHLRVGFEVAPLESPWLDPRGRAALLLAGRRVGVIGHPGSELLRTYGLKREPVYGELRLDVLQAAAPTGRTLERLDRFPCITRDLSLVVPEKVSYGALEAIVGATRPAFLESCTLLGDVYRSRQIGADSKNLVLRLVFRSGERTLTSEEVEDESRKLLEAFRTEVGATLR